MATDVRLADRRVLLEHGCPGSVPNIEVHPVNTSAPFCESLPDPAASPSSTQLAERSRKLDLALAALQAKVAGEEASAWYALRELNKR